MKNIIIILSLAAFLPSCKKSNNNPAVAPTSLLQVASNAQDSYFLIHDSLWSTGDNQYSQALGNGIFANKFSTPTFVMAGVKAVAAGNDFDDRACDFSAGHD